MELARVNLFTIGEVEVRLLVVVAVPLTEVTSALRRLVLIEASAGAVLLALAGGLAAKDSVSGTCTKDENTWTLTPVCYLEDLFVRPEHRGKGAGKALLRALAGIAVDRGCGRLEWAVLDWNEPSIAFYKKMGATAMDEWTVFRLSGDALQKLAGS